MHSMLFGIRIFALASAGQGHAKQASRHPPPANHALVPHRADTPHPFPL